MAAKYCIMSNTELRFFTGYSLVDITATGVIRVSNPESIERDQQRNWETVLQCMGLRTQPQGILEPVPIITALEQLEFGNFYQGEQKVWVWHWRVEPDAIYDLPNKPLGGLMQDFEQVPIISGLEETARFILPIFYPYGSIKNIYFKQSRLN